MNGQSRYCGDCVHHDDGCMPSSMDGLCCMYRQRYAEPGEIYDTCYIEEWGIVVRIDKNYRPKVLHGIDYTMRNLVNQLTPEQRMKVIETIMVSLPGYKLAVPLVEPYNEVDRYDYVMTPDVNMPRKCMTCVHNLGKYGPMDNCLVDIKPGEDIDLGKVRRINKKHACLQWKPVDKITKRDIHNVSLLVF